MGLSRKLRFALMLLVIVAVPGVADYLLSANGYPALGRTVWALGYGSGIVLIWYVWLRPLDITGPQG